MTNKTRIVTTHYRYKRARRAGARWCSTGAA
jgi:hypothetical protein